MPRNPKDRFCTCRQPKPRVARDETARNRSVAGLDSITALRAPAIRGLVETRAIQLSLFDQRDLAEITAPDYPSERAPWSRTARLGLAGRCPEAPAPCRAPASWRAPLSPR
jgi:hypothetical protein